MTSAKHYTTDELERMTEETRRLHNEDRGKRRKNQRPTPIVGFAYVGDEGPGVYDVGVGWLDVAEDDTAVFYPRPPTTTGSEQADAEAEDRAWADHAAWAAAHPEMVRQYAEADAEADRAWEAMSGSAKSAR